MILHLFRFSPQDHSSLGAFFIDQHFQCYMLEPETEERIPGGIYEVGLRNEGPAYEYWKSEMMEAEKGLPWIKNVPGRNYILIHPGNYVNQSDGCILTGTLCNNNIDETGKVTHSRSAFSRIIRPIQDTILQGEHVTIIIGDIVELVQFSAFNGGNLDA